MTRATVWFDGACHGNPGPMGAGAVVELAGGKRVELARPMGHGTNNQAEYHGLILGLRHALAEGATDVVVHGDSQLVLRQLGGTYKVKSPNVQPLHLEAKALLARFRSARLEWVPREQNGEADALSTRAITESQR
jgi:ribonuclease HI